MKIDLHVHVADVESLLATRQSDPHRPRGAMARVLRWAEADRLEAGTADGLNLRWIDRLAGWVKESPLDKVLLLALDGAYDETGEFCPDHTALQVDNDFVGDAVAHHPEFIFGASIHPYRNDAVAELERLVRKGAALVKWIPSGQYIDPSHPKCMAFYEVLAHYGVPLLSHTGVEHTLGSKRARYNHPQRLIPALERGVKVIAAHCGVHLFLHEPSFFNSWADMARKYEHFYGDSGAFSIVTRIPALKRILKDPVLQGKLLYGSDYPGIPSPYWCWQLGVPKMRRLAQMANPLARTMGVMQALGMPEEVFERAHKQFGIGKERG